MVDAGQWLLRHPLIGNVREEHSTIVHQKLVDLEYTVEHGSLQNGTSMTDPALLAVPLEFAPANLYSLFRNR
jgi:hypothetical protein